MLTACRALRPDRGAPDKPLRMMILGVALNGEVDPDERFASLKWQCRRNSCGDESAITWMTRCSIAFSPGMSLAYTPGMSAWPGMEQAISYA